RSPPASEASRPDDKTGPARASHRSRTGKRPDTTVEHAGVQREDGQHRDSATPELGDIALLEHASGERGQTPSHTRIEITPGPAGILDHLPARQLAPPSLTAPAAGGPPVDRTGRR